MWQRIKQKKTKAKLSKNPRSLYVLWHKCEFAIGGRKPAKSFSREERGAVRHSYSKKNLFWDFVVQMVKQGYSDYGEIDKIYAAYGFKCSITDIIKNLQKEKKTYYRQFF